MKTIQSLLFLSISLISSQAFCQFSFGIKSGYVRAWQDYGDVLLPDGARIHVHGFQASTMIYYQINKHVRIGAEPGFVQRGAACEPGFSTFNSDTEIHLNYADLPLFCTFVVPMCQNKLEAFWKVGAGTSVILSGYRQVNIFTNDNTPQQTKLLFSGPFPSRRWDFGVYGGLGVALNVGHNQFRLESNFYGGATNFAQRAISENRTVFIGLGYLYSL